MARYANPILDADWPDPDVIAVDGAYYLVASSFNRVPGLPILRSIDLVNWEIIGHALDQVQPADHFSLPRHGGGVWAPSIRHRDGRFWVVYPDPDHGIFQVSATDPAGPWTAPHPVLVGRGLIDPCPLWDDDGRAYLVFAFAKSRAGISNRLAVVEVTTELDRPIGDPRTVIDGDDLPGYRTLEGPKIYRRDGWYWIFAPAGGVAEGWQSVFRSRSIWGPYEDRIVLEQGGSTTNGPHQGGWVRAADGSEWFIHFQDRGCFGRVTHLQPLRWGADGWPELGAAGEPVAFGETADSLTAPPSLAEARPGAAQSGGPLPSSGEPDRDDDFTGALNRWWHWQSNPGPDWVRAGSGRLLLTGQPNVTGDLRAAGNVLGQQLPGQPSRINTSIALEGDGDARAGVVVLGQEYQWLGLRRSAGRLTVESARSDDPAQERVILQEPVAETRAQVEVDSEARVEVELRVDGSGLVEFAVGQGDHWRTVGEPFAAVEGRWIGAEVGLFAECGFAAGEGGSPPTGSFGPWRVTRDDAPRVDIAAVGINTEDDR